MLLLTLIPSINFMFNNDFSLVNTSSIDAIESKLIESGLDDIWIAINQRNVEKAQKKCQQFNQNHPENADGWYATSFLYFQLKQIDIALETINKAITLQPNNTQWQLHKISTYLLIPDKEQANKLAEFLKNKDLPSIEECSEYAELFTKLADYAQANFYYQQAITLIDNKIPKNKQAQLYFNLASIQRYQGSLDLAEEHLTKAISLNPHDYEAYLLRSSLKKQTEQKNHILQLEQALTQEIKHPIAKAQLLFALAKEQEDLSLFSQSFQSLKLGATTRRSHMRYDINHDLTTLKQIVSTFDASLFQSNKGVHKHDDNSAGQFDCGLDNNEAIFILGLPRTGSTLVERIISNHSDVYSAGELNNFALCMMDEVKKIAAVPPKSRTELIALTRSINFKALGENYITSTRPETGQSAQFIDKLPLNSLYIGLIHLALPKAKIIHVTRHPLDTCYSIYKQLFTNGYPFSYDLTELAQYYIEHHKMMQHWLKVLPNVIHQVAYEDVVDDLTSEAKKLISYCQLSWQSHCVDFENNSAPSTTASASQVRQKIYQKSKGQWRNYEQELLPVKQLLEQAGINCNEYS